jgi:hypothetical protein
MPQIDFPFAKVVLQDLEVVAVIHDERPNPAYGGPQSDEPPTLKGDVKALQVVLPREHAEMMHYGVTTGDYRIALLSPNAPEEDDATLGMTWKDLEAFFWGQRETALGAITGTFSVDGPGAAALVGTPQSVPMPMAPLTETSPLSITAPGEEGIEDSAPDDTDKLDSSPDDSPDESLDETSDSEDTTFSLSGSTDTDSPDAGETEAAEDSDADLAASDEQTDKQSETQDTTDDQSAAVDLDNLDRLVSASMLRGIVCLGGGLLLAGVVVFAGIRVFRNLKSGDE